MLAEALRADHIAVNSMCPGWVRTDMGGSNATLSVEEGADTAVWLAHEAPHELTGKFFRKRQEIPWYLHASVSATDARQGPPPGSRDHRGAGPAEEDGD